MNFAGQWLNLRGLDATAPLPLLYPDFDDPLRQAMRREVELLFDTHRARGSQHPRPADRRLHVRQRAAGEALRHPEHLRQPVPPRDAAARTWTSRRGLLGKGAFLATTSKPDRTSPVTRGKWIMGNILGMSPPNPPPDVPPLPPRAADPNAKEPTMRKKMETIACARTACSAIG